MTSSVAIAEAQRGGSVDPVEHRAVLVPLDGSKHSERALEPAPWLAAHLGGEVHTVVAGFVDDPDWYRSYVRWLRQAGRRPSPTSWVAST